MLAGAKPGAMAVLNKEAQTWARMAHPNLLRVHEVGTYRDPRDPRRTGVYMVRDLVSGMDMQRWLDALTRPVAMSWAQLLGMFTDAGSALAYAHAQGLVHGGFSPASIMVGYDGNVTVTDFSSRHAKPMGDTDPFASIAYAAPEMQDGSAAGALSDQYSFCATVWTSLQRVKQGKVPKRVGAILGRGMADDPALRWPSMDALLAALGRTRHGILRRTFGALAHSTPAL